MSSGQQSKQERTEQFPWPSDTPLSRLILQSGSLKSSKCPCASVVRSHHFNQQVDLFVPVSGDVTPQVRALDAEAFFYSVRLPLESLVVPHFLDEYIRGDGKEFYALLHSAPVDQTSTLAFYPPGDTSLCL